MIRRTRLNRPGAPRDLRRRVAFVTLLAVTAACGGPREPLTVGVRDFPTDVILGSQADDAPLPPTFLPPNALPAPRAIISTLPPIPQDLTSPTTSPPAGPCPTADPLSAPRREATNSVLAPPVEGTYTYRNRGETQISGANAQKIPAPAETTRSVQNLVVAPDDTFTYDVVSVLDGTTTTTSYRTVPIEAGGGTGGIFITSITTKTGDEPASTFDPSPDLELLRFPIEVGAKWTAVGADPSARTTMTYTATVQVKQRVDACGTLLDGQVVRIDGNIAPCVDVKPPAGTPAEPVKQCPPPGSGATFRDEGTSTFTATYVFGTQYGGLALFEDTVVDSNEGGVGVHRELVSTINSEPAVSKE